MRFALRFVFLTAGLLAQTAAQRTDSRRIEDPEAIGAWKVTSELEKYLPGRYRSTPAETRAFAASLTALTEVIHSTKVFQPPRGIDGDALLRPREGEWKPSGPGLPMSAEIWLRLLPNYHYSDWIPPKPRTRDDVYYDGSFFVNDLETTLPGGCFSATPPRLSDGRSICLKPVEVGRVAGFPIYSEHEGLGDGYLRFTNGCSPWVPVTREEYVSSRIREREADLRQRKADVQRQDSEFQRNRKSRAEQRKEIEARYAELEKDPVKRAKLVEDALKAAAALEGAYEKGAAQADRGFEGMERRVITPLRNELARMTAAEQTSQGWYLTTPMDGSSGLVPANTPGARGLVTYNLDYFDRSRPRTEIQLIAVRLDVNGDLPPDLKGTAPLRLVELLKTLDWRRVAQFAQPAR